MKKLGFGFMRLPMQGKEIDIEQTKEMVDRFLAAGFTYFDTAHGYIGEKSEPTLKECLVDRYPRTSYVLTDKLTSGYIQKPEDVRPFFERQLEICGVDYFDYYLLHAVGSGNLAKYESCQAFEQLRALKAEGKIKHMGMSFHDKAEVLDRILTAHPEIEVVQIQFNYVDYDDPKVESFKCYQVCEKHDKPVLIMEPVKGGNLVDLPDEGKTVLDELGGVALITADHGNADEMYEMDKKTGMPKADKNGNYKSKTSHTLNPVPCIFYDNTDAKNHYTVKKDGSFGLSNVAATTVNLMGYEAPEMWDASMIEVK